MMLDHLGERAAHDSILAAIERVIGDETCEDARSRRARDHRGHDQGSDLGFAGGSAELTPAAGTTVSEDPRGATAETPPPVSRLNTPGESRPLPCG